MSGRPGSAERLAEQIHHLRAVQQIQQSLEFAAVVGGRVELEGKSASIKSSSECIQPGNASSFSICSVSLSSCFVLCSEPSICIATTGSRRQLSIDKNERKRDSDEPDAPLLVEEELALGEVDVVIRGEENNQANNAAEHGFHQGFAVEPEAPPRRCRPQILSSSQHPK